MTGKTPFAVYQGIWNLLDRDMERDHVPMARAEGMAICPFGVLGSGRIRTDADELKRRETGEKGLSLALAPVLSEVLTRQAQVA